MGIALFGAIANLPAQDQAMQARMADVLRYTGIENASPDDVAHMTDLWTRAQQPGRAAFVARTRRGGVHSRLTGESPASGS
jgi:hypothetical protein